MLIYNKSIKEIWEKGIKKGKKERTASVRYSVYRGYIIYRERYAMLIYMRWGV